jgi:hypothetical protein
MLTKSFLGAALLALLPLSEPRQRADSAIAYAAAQDAAPALSDSAFAALVARVSEPGGYFDSDNLISNESSYLHVLGGMRRIGVNGGGYVGVGPDQNFSYMAQVRPARRVHRRHPPRQPPTTPPVQGAVRDVAESGGVSGTADGARGA